MIDSSSFTVGFVSSPHPHAPMHIKTLDGLTEVEEVHLCGLEGEDLEAMAMKSSKVRSQTSSLEKLLGLSHLDALVVSVRNDLCCTVLDAALESGLPVLFEKPGATHASDLRRVAQKAELNKVPMGAMYTNRWSPEMKDVRKIVKGGGLGKVMAVESRMVTSQVRYRDPKHWLFSKEFAGSGILSWLACHHIDLLCYLLGEPIVEVSAMVASNNPETVEVEDTAMVTVRFESGVLGTVHAGYHLAGSAAGYAGGSYDAFLGLRGVKGYISMPWATHDSFEMYSEAEGWESDGLRQLNYDIPESLAYGGKAGEEFVLDFLRACRTGSTIPAPIDAAVHVLDVIEAALESSVTGRTVMVTV